MGSKSHQTDQNVTNTSNLAISRDAITQSGTQILDSVIIDPSDKVMTEMVGGFRASFATLIDGNKASMADLVSLGQKMLDLSASNQISFAGMARDQLQTSVEWLKEQMAAGRYVIDFASAVVDKSYDFAGDALGANASALNRALEITADVKTGDFSATLKSLTATMALFALGAIYLARKG